MVKDITIKFNHKIIWFFVLLEGFTVPMVAMSNSLVLRGTYYVMAVGFLVALSVVYLLLKLLSRLIIKHSASIIDIQVERIAHIWYVAVISGILEMVMFIVQDYLFKRGYGDWSAGFWSAFISVGIALLVYKMIFLVTRFGIKLLNNEVSMVVDFSFIDVLRLSLIFGIYEFIVCPITGWWIPYYGWQRFGVAVFSAIVGAVAGSILVIVLSRLSFLRPKFSLYISTN